MASKENEGCATVPNTPSATIEKRICDACGKPGVNLLCCARCKQAWYHNKQCQVAHFPHHKAKCRQLVAAMKAKANDGTSAVPTPKANQPLHQVPEIATVDTEGQHTLADGIQIIDTDDLGKACMATKAFASGDTVLLEPPAIVFDERSGYMGLFRAFLKASPETQQKILQMYRPPDDATSSTSVQLDEKRKKIRTKRKQLLVQQYGQFMQANPQHKQALPLSLANQLIGLVDANAHAFQANHTVDLVVATTPNNENNATSKSNNNNNAHPTTYHALFTLGSRVEHSCSPNLTFITKGGKLEYLAEIDIAPQERLSISYLGGVYERPRKQRQGFLRENKTFVCKCARCLGWDECSPLRCNCGSTGILLHSGALDTWECQQCDRKIPAKDATSDNHLSQQLKGEADLHAKIKRFQYILQSQPYPEMLDEILDLVRKPKWNKILHPMHWLNVEVYKLLSSVATSAARYYAEKEDKNNNTNKNNNHHHHNSKKNGKARPEKAPSLLRLSALSMLRRIIWMGRIAAINRGLLTIPEAFQEAASENFAMFSPHATRVEDVQAVIQTLCGDSDNKNDNDQQQRQTPSPHELGCTLGVSAAFHAGQDLIVAGHKDLAWKIYKRFETSFQTWKGLSEASRSNIKIFLDSQGEDNPFGNFLLQ